MNKRIVKEKLVLKKSIRKLLNRILISIIILLIGMIEVKKNPEMKTIIRKNIYERNISFIEIKKIYKKYFGNIIIEKNKKIKPVIAEQLSYSNPKKFEDGVSLTVSNNTPIPALESGIIVFIGKKEKYGNTIIIEQVNGIDVFYSNVGNYNKKIYDYIEKGDIIGEAQGNNIILVFQKNGKYLDYQKYI